MNLGTRKPLVPAGNQFYRCVIKGNPEVGTGGKNADSQGLQAFPGDFKVGRIPLRCEGPRGERGPSGQELATPRSQVQKGRRAAHSTAEDLRVIPGGITGSDSTSDRREIP